MSHFFDNADPEKLKRIFAATDVKRLPITGIVAGYHTLPFTLVGPNDETEANPSRPGSLKLTGKITVGPKLVFSLGSDDANFAEMFPESEPFMDRSLVGRVFSFSAAYQNRQGPRLGERYRVRNEHLSVEASPESDADLLERVLNELNRAEIINMGVIWCPQPRFYPVSIERFIFSVLDKEFK